MPGSPDAAHAATAPGAHVAWRFYRWSLRTGPIGRRAALHLLIALPVLLVAIWVSTGSLAPYSAVDAPREMLRCGYTANTDHGHFYETYLMLKGYPIAEWGESEMLRRLLYPILAYPFFEVFGYYFGGLIFNTLLHVAALVLWSFFLFRVVGRRGAVAGTWLLATFPGIAYFVGLPYPYAAIVPATIAGLVLLHGLDRRRRLAGIALHGLGLGALSQAYDLAVFFAPAAIVLLLINDRRPGAFAALLAGIALPFAVTHVLVVHLFSAPSLGSPNSAAYGLILEAYLGLARGDIDGASWWALLSSAPAIVVRNLTDATFSALPALLLAMLIAAAVNGRIRLDRAAVALLGTVVAVCAFNNAAPPYPGWQLRGEWIARLYMPAFAPMIFLVATQWRVVDATRWPWRAMGGLAIAATCLVQASVVGGGILGNASISNDAYVRFYEHNGPRGYSLHLDTYGRRPVGFCLPPERQAWPALKQVPD